MRPDHAGPAVVWIFAAIALAGSASADHAADIVNATKAMESPSHELHAAHQNLRQMRRALSASDKQAIDSILWAADLFLGISSETKTVGIIFKNMDAQSDRVFVGAVFEETARSSVVLADNAIEEINTDLPSLSNPAALAEATKLRDLIIKLRDIVAPLARKG
jgi:hypothetical protein